MKLLNLNDCGIRLRLRLRLRGEKNKEELNQYGKFILGHDYWN